jgi:hypothetical protein
VRVECERVRSDNNKWIFVVSSSNSAECHHRELEHREELGETREVVLK